MKALILMSGGIDSAVAAYLMLKNKVDLTAIHYDNRPLTDEKPLEKTKKLINILEKKFNKKIKLIIKKHGKNQIKLLKKINHRHLCLLCRRIMYRTAEEVAKKEKCQYIVTGEILGSVASQTLENLRVESEAIEMAVLRPLLCYNKDEVIKIAKEIGTFETSILPGVCCTAVPKHPTTKANLKIIKEEEAKL